MARERTSVRHLIGWSTLVAVRAALDQDATLLEHRDSARPRLADESMKFEEGTEQSFVSRTSGHPVNGPGRWLGAVRHLLR